MIITYQTTRWMEIDPAVFRSSTLVGINILPEYKLFIYLLLSSFFTKVQSKYKISYSMESFLLTIRKTIS